MVDTPSTIPPQLSEPRRRKVVRVAAFTGGRTTSSPRFRVRQYIGPLKEQATELNEFPARFGSWPPSQKAIWPLWAPATLVDRIPGVMKSHQCDITLLQREMVSTFVTLERFTKAPRILDIDDAVWLNRNAEKSFAALSRMCEAVICGNNFIADNVVRWNPELITLPTAVDTGRFRPTKAPADATRKKIIGWSGLYAGSKYLLSIESALARTLDKHKDAILRVVSDVRPRFRVIDPARVEYIRWSEQNEVATIQQMSVGLMPLDDSLWSRGKCSYKMLLYMACGVPVVVSPVGMNNEVLALGSVGFGPRSDSEWVDSISYLLENPGPAALMGAEGRRIIEEHFSLEVLSPRLAGYLRKFSQ
jgi:glycosyltransferase involved in cell wall biosynthesis